MTRAVLAWALAALGGCAAARSCRSLDANPSNANVAGSLYAVACPDVLDVTVGQRPDASGSTPVTPDGTILLGNVGRMRVDGLTTDQIAARLATILRVDRNDVQIRVTDYASRQVYLCGPVAGHEKAVPYEGPEPVVDFLRRTGGLSREAETREVQVVRANVAAGRRPEVFPVDLQAIVTHGDNKTNVPLQPYDQVYVGETRRAQWMKYLPPWLQFSSRQPAAGSGQ
jgi:polysaccharide export outer membrane protein